MKILAFTAALLLSGTAIAQMTPPAGTSTPRAPAAGDMQSMPTTPPTDPATPDAPMPSTNPTTPDGAVPSTGTMPNAPVAPSTPAPGEMMQPPATPRMAPMASAAAPAPQAEYPRCSATVTDQCIQGPVRERNTRRRR